jgi:hypothetical protein
MSWISGGELAEDVWDGIRLYVSSYAQELVAKRLVELFESRGCDNLQGGKLWMAAFPDWKPEVEEDD